MLKHRDLTHAVLGAAIEVHKALGPGLLESAYEECLCYELKLRRLSFDRQIGLSLSYKGTQLECGYRMDVVVERTVLLELKAIENILPVHEAQLLTYLSLSQLPIGFLINFNVPILKQGIVRRVL